MILRVIVWFAFAVTAVLQEVILPAAGTTYERPEVTVGCV
jgi:hypothetical protein